MSPTTASPQLVVTSGTFSIDGEDFDVDNNIWIVGNDEECLIVDAAHEAGPIVDAVDGRRVVALVCTHGHNDHINAAVAVADATGAPIALHADDLMLWENVNPGRPPDLLIEDGSQFDVGDATLVALHTPGHSPGGVSLHDADHHAIYGGDTLFKGGPGATGRSFSDFPTIIESIRARLLTLPADTVVYTGHGDTTTIGDEAPQLDEWIARGH
jgi:glyoxylase-like metal-dependent hydrolase (beta-lactamase superfamily II)